LQTSASLLRFHCDQTLTFIVFRSGGPAIGFVMPFLPKTIAFGALRDILFNINAAERFAHGQTFESLRDDLMRLYAIIRSLEIISEASRRLSDELKARYPDIPWRNGCSRQLLSP
jgi:hypothetical protein